MNIEVHHGIGDFRGLLELVDELAVVAGVRMLGEVIFHAQPAVVLLKALNLSHHGKIRIALPKVANDKVLVFERQVEGL